MYRFLAITAVLALASPAYAGSVSLQLNTEAGVPGLEQMLDIARRNAPTMREADMAVSLYNALQAAKAQSAQAEAQHAKGLEDENAKLKADLDKAKKATAPPEEKPK